MFKFLKRFFGSAQERKISPFAARISKINKIYNEIKDLSSEDWNKLILNFKEKNSSVKALLPVNEVILGAAITKAAASRIYGNIFIVMGNPEKWNMIHFDEQLIAGMAMYNGYVAEMQTGEGKTLSAVLPLFLHSIQGQALSITVNDFLAQRDCEWMKPLFSLLHTTVGYIKNNQDVTEKRRAYSCNIVYGTSSEFGFDYLRDHSTATSKNELINQKPYRFVVVDEVDQVLIIDSKIPLIISGPSGDPSPWYLKYRDEVEKIVKKNEDICSKIIDEVEIVFESHLWMGSRTEEHSKNVTKTIEEAAKKTWLVNRSSPQNKKLLKMMEYANIRSLVDMWDVYFSYEHNKDEMHILYNDILITKNDHTRDYELTERGLKVWESECDDGSSSSFKMMDLHNEILKVNSNDELEEEDKKHLISELQRKDTESQEKASCIKNLFHAFVVMRNDYEYVVDNDEIVLIDESTGRLQYGRRFSNGLHQAIEAKERVSIKKESKTIASITVQNFIKIFEFIAGMSGTAITHELEFSELYEMQTISIPPHKPSNRIDLPDNIFVTKREKFSAIVSDVSKVHSTSRPILIGTYSIEETSAISSMLSKLKLPHKVLSAKNHKLEASIIAKAGQKNAITIATNIAGRGTDIKLDVGVNALGGMHVIVTSRGTSRAQDLQFRGRQGRQGDRGSCQFYISFEDDLLKTFQSPVMSYVLKNHRPPEGEAMVSPLLSKAIATAQERLEHSSYQSRKNTLEYDEVINQQRKQIYEFRDAVVLADNQETINKNIIYNSCKSLVDEFRKKHIGEIWNGDSFREYLISLMPLNIKPGLFNKHYNSKTLTEDLYNVFIRELHKIEGDIYNIIKAAEINGLKFLMDNLVSRSIIMKIDEVWRMYIESMESVQQYVQLRAIGQKDPIVEYRKESSKLFSFAKEEFDLDILSLIMNSAISEKISCEKNIEAIKESISRQMNNKKEGVTV